MEEAEEQRRSVASRSAKLRAVLDRNTLYPALLVINDGKAKARDISVKINGIPIMELKRHPEGHLIVRDQKQVRQLGPGGSARYILTRTAGIGSLFEVDISWADKSNAAKSWCSELSLAAAGD